MYTIAVDAPQNLISVTLTGMMSVDEVGAYIADLRQAFVRNRMRTGYRLVIDVSGCTIQTQDMIRSMGEHMVSMPKASAIAVVTGSSLARMQVRRLFTQSYARVTSTIEEARAWVLSGTEPSEDHVPQSNEPSRAR